MPKLKILVAGRAREAVDAAATLLAEHSNCHVSVRVISNGQVDPLRDVRQQPDLLLLCDYHAQGELQTLSELAPGERPAIIVFGSGEDATAVRLAMRAGARDYLTTPLQREELFGLVDDIASERAAADSNDNGKLHVFINGKGGSGATLLVTNVAHGLAAEGRAVTLVDLDLQFAGLCRYLDLKPKEDILEAIQAVRNLDETAAKAFATEHDSGLRLLATQPNQLKLNQDVAPEKLLALLDLYRSFNDFVFVDMPRQIDYLNAAVLEQADHVTVVMQQSFPHLHDTARLLHILRDDMGIKQSQLTVVVNRYAKNSAISLKDIESSLPATDFLCIPNHYRLTSESVNSGIPLVEMNRKATVSKGLRELCERLSDDTPDAKPDSGLSLTNFFRR